MSELERLSLSLPDPAPEHARDEVAGTFAEETGQKAPAAAISRRRSGRPRAVIDWPLFDRLCAIQCTQAELAAFFRCSEDTIARAVRREKHVPFADYAAAQRLAGHVSLRRTMWQKALKGDNTMAIFLAKQHLGMADRQQHEVTGANGGPLAPVQIYLPENLRELRERLVNRLGRLGPPAGPDAAGPDDDAQNGGGAA